MKAYSPFDLNGFIDGENKKTWENAQKLLAAREVTRRFAPLFKHLSFFYELTVYHFTEHPILQFYVDRIADVEPALALIEDELGVSFDRSTDNSSTIERQFSAANLPFRVDVAVRPSSPHCKRVIVGYTQTPQYKIVCDEEEKEVEASNPKLPADDDLPF